MCNRSFPLPEAADFTVRLKKREAAARVARETSRDYSKYIIITPNEESLPLNKRRAILSLVKALHTADAGIDEILGARGANLGVIQQLRNRYRGDTRSAVRYLAWVLVSQGSMTASRYRSGKR